MPAPKMFGVKMHVLGGADHEQRWRLVLGSTRFGVDRGTDDLRMMYKAWFSHGRIAFDTWAMSPQRAANKLQRSLLDLADVLELLRANS